ncbi:nucleotidyltransferase family protein [Amycolatopsis sp. SID8362]|uniref:nucleotidyltransferase family protein n=1 Tax=Amycolatopsis sp. SID8362 TaxID=2690346 RepID=UPI00136C51DD|nr:nucleotidyltransferase family protein [Amycolatopsis sp. SID8362]NBH10740.1 NTP transferase domain-containing protein [Amycolatopsis sp. SID8362]NED47434.1 nucleotidyltransferase family protein [Amycolatopsis sp. SID8362]
MADHAATGTAPQVAGLLLAAGAGRRFGGPKALAELDGEPLVRRALRTLTEAGCTPIRVVLGAAADQVRPLLPDPTAAVYSEDWQTGMGASLRAGLTALTETDGPVAALVHLVDLPWIGPEILTRVTAEATPRSIARAAYHGTPGHPVLLGRDWWPEIAATARGDRGARDWLATRTDLNLIECADLGNGRDVDRPADLPGQSPS